jgi:L,D-transpeptidase ErfK/SrfK
MKKLKDIGLFYSLLFMAGLTLLLLASAISTSIVDIGDKRLSRSQSDSLTKVIQLEISTIKKRLRNAQPVSAYLVINSTANEFYLNKDSTTLKRDKCSTGSYVMLKNGDLQQWIFKTPKGEFKILNKRKNPVWKKPDWAFVEEGLPVPSPNHPSRFEYGVLGDYALGLGDGYLIHGTIYQRFIGLPVTHGCIRLNDENLELIYKTMPVGAKVYLF